jgi:hypothetical protein
MILMEHVFDTKCVSSEYLFCEQPAPWGLGVTRM